MKITSTNSTKISVVIVDDHAVLSELIMSVVDSLKSFRVAGRAQTEAEALALCRRVQPNVVILDLVLTASSGLTLLEKLGLVCPGARVVVFSGNLNPGLIAQALSAGAFSLISKSVTLEEFRAALLAVAENRTYFSPEISDAIKTLIVTPSMYPSGGRPKLSRKEEVVLIYLARGLSSKEIAATLGVSIYTVANHRSRLMKKTGLTRAAQLSLYAERRGLLNQMGVKAPA
jgi:DNA-binding NarL/FixJ family response regulator